MSNAAAKASKTNTKLSLVKDRREKTRGAPSYPSRKKEKLVDGLSKSELVVKYATQVRMIAAKISRSLPEFVDVEDLISVGYIGLMDAADKFDPNRNVKFSTFAEFRIRGAILDELRNQDWVPRSIRGQVKAIEKAYIKVESEKGRPPTEAEVTKALGMSAATFQKMKHQVGSLSLLSFGDLTQLPAHESKVVQEALEVRSGTDPYVEATRKDAQAMLEKLFEVLTNDEKLVVSCYYYRGLNLREISTILAVSESRISQIHSKAIYKLKEQFKGQVPHYGEGLIHFLIDQAPEVA